MFYNKLNKENYESFEIIRDGCGVKSLNKEHPFRARRFINTELSKYIIRNNLLFSSSHHEGLTFDFKFCKPIIDFLDNNDNIKNNLFDWNDFVEEFALQTICINIPGYYYNIGVWNDHNVDDSNNIHKLPKNLYVYKTLRL